MNEDKESKYTEIAITALRNQYDNALDDLIRAQRQAGRLSEEEMDREWGNSGSSWRQHLNRYQATVEELRKALVWLSGEE